ncbi:MAG: DUF305 domain-containing protein [Mycobacterium leprae]
MYRLGSLSRGVLAGVAAVALLVGFASSAAAREPAPNRSTARFEINFMKNMIDHHAMAVRMAEMCRDRAVHSQLRSMCKDIETSQRREIREMRSWLRDWYNTDHQPSMMHMPAGEMRRMHEMQMSSGRQFEIHFMTMMIPHHEQAIREAKTCRNRAHHGDLRQLCRNIIKTQAAEIRTMRSWLCKWYDRCDGRHEGRPGQGHHGRAA